MALKKNSIIHSVDLDTDPGYQLWVATHALQRAFRKGLEPLHLTFVQFFVLAAIARLGAENESVSQAQVCRFSAMDPNMVSQVVKTLEKKGLIERFENPTDRRSHRLAIKPAGETLAIAALERLLPISDAFFSPLAGQQSHLAEMLRFLASEP